MEPLKSKLKPVELKLNTDLLDLEKFHPIRDMDTNIILDHLEAEIKKRSTSFSGRLKLQK